MKKSCVDFRPCQELVLAVVKSLVDEDLGVAVDAKDVLHAQISRDHNFGSQVVFGTHSQILNEMAKNEKETLRMRLYDFVVAVAKVGSTGHHSPIYYDGPNCAKEIPFLAILCAK